MTVREANKNIRPPTATEVFRPTIVTPPAAEKHLQVRPAAEDAGQADQLRALQAALGDLLFKVRKDGLVLEFRAPPDAEFGLSAEEVVGKRVMELLPAPVGHLAMHYLEKTFRSGVTEVFTCQYLLPKRVRIFEGRLAQINPGCALALVRDVTDRQMLENELIESSHRVQMRIGQDLHDGLGQHLTGISFLSRALEKKLAADGLPETVDAAEISRLVLEAIAQTRNLARGLSPAELEGSGLIPALQELAGNVEEIHRIACSLECQGSVSSASPDTAMHLFRLAQEAVNNAVKHAQAHRIVIRLRGEPNQTVLQVEDDGVGFTPGHPPGKGLGLRIMSYRAQKIGGILEIQPGVSRGTVVTCAFRPEAPAASTVVQ